MSDDETHLHYIYIAARPHSGTTLLSKCLNSQPSVLNLGEFKHFAAYVSENKDCGCGKSLQTCEFWGRVLKNEGAAPERVSDVLPTDGVRSDAAWVNRLYHVALLCPPLLRLWSAYEDTLASRNLCRARNHWRFAQTAADVANVEVLVDKSMSLSRFLELYRTCPPDVQMSFVHLVRDGRGNAHSMSRRTGGSVVKAAREWKWTNLVIELVKSVLPRVSIQTLHYEELCRSPEIVCERALRSVEASAHGHPSLDTEVDHGIGGNSGSFQGYESIRLDERWKRQLSNSDLEEFNATAGWLNRQYGYR
ncbi:hypothetical protein [Salinibacter sp.]|uniref:hypothetical protein n=1 Tax=Salinibacter sp. TaxID=2065818 RepID=UPI0021E93881|nr:hypothetical protein [Salinibacter sp.]